MYNIILNDLKFNDVKNYDKILTILKKEFATCEISTLELLKSSYIVSHCSSTTGVIVYCAINKIEEAPDGVIIANFSYSWLNPLLRKNGLGRKFFKERMKYIQEHYGNIMMSATIRESNASSLAIVKKLDFITVGTYTYKDREKGMRMIRLPRKEDNPSIMTKLIKKIKIK